MFPSLAKVELGLAVAISAIDMQKARFQFVTKRVLRSLWL